MLVRIRLVDTGSRVLTLGLFFLVKGDENKVFAVFIRTAARQPPPPVHHSVAYSYEVSQSLRACILIKQLQTLALCQRW